MVLRRVCFFIRRGEIRPPNPNTVPAFLDDILRLEYRRNNGHAPDCDSMENYHGVKKIGRGSYGEVWLVRNKKDKKQHVLKQINLQNASKRELRAANLEVQLLATLRHPNIVSYHDSFESNDGFLYIVMGYCEGGDLYSKIKEQKGVNFDESQIVEWFIQICMAIQYLHERNILHRDLKTQNIFLTKSKIVKVGDLGIAKVLDGETAMATTLIGTPYYMSPELFCNRPYNYKSDVWALGCCIYEIATLRHAFNARDMNALMYKIIRGKVPSMPTIYSTELLDLIRGMLNHNPDKRPSISRILRHAYIKKNISIFLEGTRLKQKHASNGIADRPPAVTGKPTSNNRPAVVSKMQQQPCFASQQANAQKLPARDCNVISSNGLAPKSVRGETNLDLSVHGKKLSPEQEVPIAAKQYPPPVPLPSRRAVAEDAGSAQPEYFSSDGSNKNGGLNLVVANRCIMDVVDDDSVYGNRFGGVEPRFGSAKNDNGAKSESFLKSSIGVATVNASNVTSSEIRDRLDSDCLTCHDELCIDGQEIVLGDRPNGGHQSPPKGSPERAAGRRSKKVESRRPKVVPISGKSYCNEALQKDSEDTSSLDEDQSSGSSTTTISSGVTELPQLATSNKENEMVAQRTELTTVNLQPSNASTENKPRVRRRKKLHVNQEVKSVFDNPLPVANHRPLPPVPPAAVEQVAMVLPYVASIKNSPLPTRRPNSAARQRRREKLSQERDEIDNMKSTPFENALSGNLDNSAGQRLNSNDKPAFLDRNNSDQDMVCLIDLLNTTLKNELESPPTSVVVTPKKPTPTKIGDAEDHSPYRCSSRLEQRFQVLESDCLKGLGEDLFHRAMVIIAEKDAKEMQDELQSLMGKDKCHDFIGKLWQLKLCKESLQQ